MKGKSRQEIDSLSSNLPSSRRRTKKTWRMELYKQFGGASGADAGLWNIYGLGFVGNPLRTIRAGTKFAAYWSLGPLELRSTSSVPIEGSSMQPRANEPPPFGIVAFPCHLSLIF